MSTMSPNGNITIVTGRISPSKAGIADGHNHVWIAPVPGVSGAPVLDDKDGITAELCDYYAAGGRTILDCQPGGCGRDGRVLLQLARASGVYIVACTGFHLRRYYPANYWLWNASLDDATAYFVREITQGLDETRGSDTLVCAGFMKIACEDDMDKVPAALWEAAAQAAVETDVMIEVHTEKGAQAEQIAATLTGFGLRPEKLVLCHMDKRPDFDLHRHLAEQGVALEYDTFYRPKYQPDQNLWPLLEQMVGAGLERQVVIATDMADSTMWQRLGGEPGLVGLMTRIIPRLQSFGFSEQTVTHLTVGNVTERLARDL